MGAALFFLKSFAQISHMKLLESFKRYDNCSTRPRVIYQSTYGLRVCAEKKGCCSVKITDLIISPKSLGEKLWLVDVAPAYAYVDGKRSDKITGYRYSVALPERGLDKIDVRIDGEKQMETPNGYVEVRFDELEVSIYWSKGDYHVAAKAAGIHTVNAKT